MEFRLRQAGVKIFLRLSCGKSFLRWGGELIFLRHQILQRWTIFLRNKFNLWSGVQVLLHC